MPRFHNNHGIRFGVEIENGWQPGRTVTLPPEWGSTRDGSLWSQKKGGAHLIELRSPVYPLDPKGIKKFVTEVKAIKAAGGLHETNKSMGVHIHVSFRSPTSMTLLCQPAFVKKVDDFAKSYAGRFDRMARRPENRFCKLPQPGFWRDPFRDRYQAVNYSACMRHGTIEFRIFAVTKRPELYRRYARFVKDILNEWLDGEGRQAVYSSSSPDGSIQVQATVDSTGITLHAKAPRDYEALMSHGGTASASREWRKPDGSFARYYPETTPVSGTGMGFGTSFPRIPQNTAIARMEGISSPEGATIRLGPEYFDAMAFPTPGNLRAWTRNILASIANICISADDRAEWETR